MASDLRGNHLFFKVIVVVAVVITVANLFVVLKLLDWQGRNALLAGARPQAAQFPVVVGGGVQGFEEVPAYSEGVSGGAPFGDEFGVVVRKAGDGSLLAVWDDSAFDVWSIAVFEVSEDNVAYVAGMPEPVFLVRSGRFFNSTLADGAFLKSPYRLGAAVPEYEVLPGGFTAGSWLQLKDGGKYMLQALRFYRNDIGNQINEAKHFFFYEK